MNTLIVAQGLLIYGLLCWKLSHLARAPRDLPLRCVVACLACAAAAYPFGIVFASRTSSPGARWLMVTQCSLLLGVVYCLDCFFLFSLLAADAASKRTVRSALALTAAVASMAVAASMVPAGIGMDDQSVPAVAVVYLVFDVSMGYFLVDAGRRTLLGIREAPSPTARGLRLACAGLALMVVGLVLLTAVTILHAMRLAASAVLAPAGQALVVPGIVTFLVGVCYPGAVMRLSAARLWKRRRQTYRQLAPLWTALHEAFPQDALTRVPTSPWREALSPWSVHRRFYRRVIECRDGLVRLSPYLDLPSDYADGLLADRLIQALQELDTTAQIPCQAMPVAVPRGGGLDADADELARLSRQLSKRTTVTRICPAADTSRTSQAGGTTR